ncbi:MAG: molybdopterin-dependent oxidoreductase [Dehalococcoidales bacterium]|jgi:anaerobic selenocysteine-containing dehydrogenase
MNSNQHDINPAGRKRLEYSQMVKPAEVKDGICYMCTNTCATSVQVRDGQVVKIDVVDPKVSHCPRWRAQTDFIYHPDRLLYPLKRAGKRGGGKWQRISWNEALDTVAGSLQTVKNKYGAEAVVFWVAYPKEPRPYFHRLAHAFGSPNYCTESSNCFSATWLAANLTYGAEYSYMAGSGSGVDPETRCKLIWGAAVISSPNVWEQNLEAKEKGVKLIVVDPRRTAIAAKADIHLQLRPGTDGALALSMMHVIFNENLYDKEFVEKWTVGFEGLKKLAQEYPPERAEKITRVPAAKIIEAARLYATLKPAKLHLSSNSTTHHSNGVQNHRAVILLAAVTGNIGIAGGNLLGPYPADKTNDITLHERVAAMPPGVGAARFPVWTQRYREMQSNAIADQIESGRPYPIKALFSSGLDIQFFANSRRMAADLEKLDFIGVTEYFHTPGTREADIVLPIASWLERPILLTDAGGYVKLIQPAVSPPGECRTEWDIYSALAGRLGLGELFWNGSFEKCVDHILEPMQLTYRDLTAHPEGILRQYRPRPEKDYETTGFQTASGKVEIASSVLAEHGIDPLPSYQEPPESPLSRPDLLASFPLVMTSGARVMAYTHSQFRNIPRLRRIMPEPLADINPADAAPRGIKTGDEVTITSPRGSIKMKANVTDTILAGVVSMPHHWPDEANVNLLVDDRTLDPISGFIPCKSQLCQVTKSV